MTNNDDGAVRARLFEGLQHLKASLRVLQAEHGATGNHAILPVLMAIDDAVWNLEWLARFGETYDEWADSPSSPRPWPPIRG
jgi:hypothetical protein